MTEYEGLAKTRALLEHLARDDGLDGAAMDDDALRRLLHRVADGTPDRAFPYVISYIELVGLEPDAIGLLEEMLWSASPALVDRLEDEAMGGSEALRSAVQFVHVGGPADPVWDRVLDLQRKLASR